jgi:arylsulfatase A-like enzyme
LRRSIEACVLAVLLALCAACAEQRVPAAEVPARLATLDRPNVVLLLADTLRADWLTPYGHREDTSPEVAAWARRGILFEQVRSQSSWTKTSMASLMTSLWPAATGVLRRHDGLAEGALTLARAFQEAGYRTYGVQSNGWLEQTFGFQLGFERYMFPRGGGNPAMRTSIWPHADNVLREAVRLLDAHPTEAPFFLYLHFMDVHEYAAPPRFHRFGTDAAGAYKASIRWLDHALRELRGHLADRRLLARTILVLASDHGETFGEDGLHGHAKNVLSPVLHVPLVLRLPFPTEPIRVSTLARNIDIAPTLLEMAGLAVPEGFQGRSLLPLVAGTDAGERVHSFASLDELLFPDGALQRSVTDGSWTYARNPDGEDGASGELLFDRRVDRWESVNLIDAEQPQAARLRQVLDRHWTEPTRPEVRAEGVRIDPRLAEKLRALGYGS